MAYTPVWPAWKDSMACRSNDHGLSLLNGIVDSFRITDLESRTNRWFPFFVILDIRPAPPCIPQIRPLADLSLHLAVTLFNGTVELVQIAFNLQEIVIREFSPVLLKMSLELTPTLFELLRVHDALLEKTACPLFSQHSLLKDISDSGCASRDDLVQLYICHQSVPASAPNRANSSPHSALDSRIVGVTYRTVTR